MQELTFAPETTQTTSAPKRFPYLVKNFLLTLSILAVAVATAQVMDYYAFEPAEIILVYTLFIAIISGVTPGYACGILAALACAFFYAFLIVPPKGTFQFSYKFTLTVFIMLLVTISISVMTARMKKQKEQAVTREQRAALLFEINQHLLATRDLDRIIRVTSQYLLFHLQRSVVFYMGHPTQDEQGYFSAFPGDAIKEDFTRRSEVRNATLAFTSKQEVLSRTGTAELEASSHVLYLPVVYHDRALGVIGVSCLYKSLEEDDRIFLDMLLSQVALSLELERLSQEQTTARTEAERERMRSSLLRAISHDLRTPLTSILGASSTLLESDLDPATKKELVLDIKDGSEWLIRMVENLLSITRISDDTAKVDKTPEAAEEVVAQAVSIIRSRFPDASIHVKVPEKLLMVPMDATLISQVLINLLENAVKNSHPNDLILVNLKKEEASAIFEVSDHGSGISEELLSGLFEMHPIQPKRSADATRGMGIGLSICETIIHAHDGEIDGRNKESGGAIFTFTLPLEEVPYEP